MDLDLPRAGFKYKHVTRSRPLDWHRSFQLALVALFQIIQPWWLVDHYTPFFYILSLLFDQDAFFFRHGQCPDYGVCCHLRLCGLGAGVAGVIGR